MTEEINSNLIVNWDDIIGDIEYHHEFYSTHLKNERDIIVWLPPSYHDSDKVFPVLYMQDGQNLFNPFTSFSGYDWKVDEVTTGLINAQQIEEIIVVGINNTHDRLNEYNFFTQAGKKYTNFFLRELKPFIDDKYKTVSKVSGTAIMGSSLGGLISFQLFWKFPNVFGKAACLSNSFWVNDGEVFKMVNEVDSLIITSKNKLYLDCGTEEKELISDYRKMVKILSDKKFEKGKNFYHHLDQGSHHTEFDWAKRLHIPLKFLFGK